jgi:tRNA A37 threonylcarbamoyladenosine synthetase subunit TsaC/SUA5/YrdC
MVPDGTGHQSVTAVKVTTSEHKRELMDSLEAATRVVDIISSGGLALVPFDVAYAFLAGSREPLEKIYQLKLRPADKACPILVSREQFLQLVDAKPEEIARVDKVIRAGLPIGVLTRAHWENELARSIPKNCIEFLVSDERVGLFTNMGGMSEDLLSIATERGMRLFGSSANISGMGNSFSPEDVPVQIVEAMDIVCETGACKYSNSDRLPSSIVDITTGQLIRRGILHEEIERLLDG